jgi:predicted nucleotidyltransferase component of viral defense system
MLDLEQIASFFPPPFRPFHRNILREYLQYKILQALYAQPHGRELVFLGGTAIHLIHGNPRFSEDLDFDNQGVSPEAFTELTTAVQRSLALEGYAVELKVSSGNALRAHLRFVGLLQALGITGHREEKLLIHLDTEPQAFSYTPEQRVINRFDVLCRIHVVPVDILLAQKLCCILQRPRAVGRDFYDAMYLWGKTEPNDSYLLHKAAISNRADLWNTLRARYQALDLEQLGRDLEPFVVDPAEARKVALFGEFIDDKAKR